MGIQVHELTNIVGSSHDAALAQLGVARNSLPRKNG